MPYGVALCCEIGINVFFVFVFVLPWTWWGGESRWVSLGMVVWCGWVAYPLPFPGPLRIVVVLAGRSFGFSLAFLWLAGTAPPPPLLSFTVLGVVCFHAPGCRSGVLLPNRIRVPTRLVQCGRLPTGRPHANLRRIGGRRQRSVSLVWLASCRLRRSVPA